MFRIFEPGTLILESVLALALLASSTFAQASTFKVLHTFTGGSDGCYPGYGSLIMDNNNNLYGTTVGETCGETIFKLAPDGTETILFYMPRGKGGDGPEALLMDKKGNLWGTAAAGGINSGGVIFEITSRGKEKLVHTFMGQPNDGCSPDAALIEDASGKFYGTTTGCGRHNGGAVFELAADGAESLLHSFNLNLSGYSPFAGLIMDAGGNLYGADVVGGRDSDGTVFKIAPDGTENVLHTFKGSPNDGSLSDGTLISDQSGNLFGTTHGGGLAGCFADEGCGVVFKLAPDRKETVLHFFGGGSADGANPVAGVIADGGGNLCGTTEFGSGNNACNGANGCGTIFEIAPDGTETILHSFGDGSKGANPSAGLVADAAGNLYGTTAFGGADNYGTVFEITP